MLQGACRLATYGRLLVVEEVADDLDVLGVADRAERPERLHADARQPAGDRQLGRARTGLTELTLGRDLETHLVGRQCSSRSPATTAGAAESAQTYRRPRAPHVRTQ